VGWGDDRPLVRPRSSGAEVVRLGGPPVGSRWPYPCQRCRRARLEKRMSGCDGPHRAGDGLRPAPGCRRLERSVLLTRCVRASAPSRGEGWSS